MIAHVVDSKPQRKISCRPITRRFAAQLLAKAQAAVDENNVSCDNMCFLFIFMCLNMKIFSEDLPIMSDLQKALAEVVNGIVAGKNCVGTKAVVASAEKRVTLKEKTKTVKVISPVMKKSPLCGRKTKRTGKSYTSVLTARSKVFYFTSQNFTTFEVLYIVQCQKAYFTFVCNLAFFRLLVELVTN